MAIEELVKTKIIYDKTNNLRLTGEALSITREAVRLRLNNYRKYFPEKYTPKLEEIRTIIRDNERADLISNMLTVGYKNIKHFLKDNNIRMSVLTFQNKFDIPTEVLAESRKIYIVNKAASDYRKLCLTIGSNVNASVLQKKYRPLYASIFYNCGGFKKFKLKLLETV